MDEASSVLDCVVETSSRTMEKEMKSYGLCSLKGGRWGIGF